MAGHITLEQSLAHEGRVWRLFSVNYLIDDTPLSFYIHAISKEHASYLLEAIKETALLADGQIIDVGNM